MRCLEGETINLTSSFLDYDGRPLLPAAGSLGPEVRILEKDRSIVAESVAVVGEEAGTWEATFSIPVLDLEDEVTLNAEWSFVDDDGIKYRNSQEVIVEPQTVHRPTDIVVCMADPEISEFYTVIVPTQYKAGMDIKIRLFLNNQLLSSRSISDTDAKIVRETSNYFEILVPVVGSPRKLEPHMVQIYVQRPNIANYDLYQYKLWATTPQMHIAVSLVEDYINKARLDNVIPQLDYTTADIMSYLYRGLALFNRLGPRMSAFTGTNMQGILMDNWVTCGCYYALASQLQAEGALAFDFSGQSVSLNMDRSPAIESALGRVEQVISDQIVATKKLLARAGVFQGDGSIGGGFIDGSKQFGVIGYAFAPTTKIGAGVVNGSKAWNVAHYSIGIR
jgi:hypothetical protein